MRVVNKVTPSRLRRTTATVFWRFLTLMEFTPGLLNHCGRLIFYQQLVGIAQNEFGAGINRNLWNEVRTAYYPVLFRGYDDPDSKLAPVNGDRNTGIDLLEIFESFDCKFIGCSITINHGVNPMFG